MEGTSKGIQHHVRDYMGPSLTPISSEFLQADTPEGQSYNQINQFYWVRLVWFFIYFINRIDLFEVRRTLRKRWRTGKP